MIFNPEKEVPADHDKYAQFCRCSECFKERLRQLARSSGTVGILQGAITAD